MELGKDEILGQIVAPFQAVFCGRSNIGKSSAIFELIERRSELIKGTISKVYYVYGIDSPEYHVFAAKHKDVTFTSEFDLSEIGSETLVVLDDFQTMITGKLNKVVTEFCIRNVSHMNTSLIIVLHNFYASPALRTITLQSDFIVVWNNARDRQTISHISRQMFPSSPSFLKDVMNYLLTKSNRAKICIDLSIHQNNRFRVRSSVFIDDDCLFFTPV